MIGFLRRRLGRQVSRERTTNPIQVTVGADLFEPPLRYGAWKGDGS